ncbi:MAG: alpha/beta hydrolase [Caulobacterales bacterium]
MIETRDELDHAVFDPSAIEEDTRAFLELFAKATAGAPSAINTPIPALREARAKGTAVLPAPVRLDSGESVDIPGPAGAIALRIFRPEVSHGGYLHFHGGGFVMGGPDQQDVMLERIARETGLTVVSAGYRLAPEHRFPAAPDDCVAAARWFLGQADAGAFGGPCQMIGGESAGAYLAVTTLLRLRDEGRSGAFRAAVLTFGAFDLSMTPSARNWGERYAIISTPILRKYLEVFLPDDVDPTAPEVSPLYADLAGLPRALFTVGTQDPLLDDSLFMAQRWRAAGNAAELAVYAGGIHAFSAFPISIGRRATQRQLDFMRAAREQRS